MKGHILLCFLVLILISSCKSRTDKAQDVVRDYITASSSSDTAFMKSSYPLSSPFVDKIPQISELTNLSVEDKGKKILVKGTAGYYDEKSHYVQTELSFWVEEKDGKLIIVDSMGLLSVPEDLGLFPYRTGALRPNSKDVEIGTKMADILEYFYTECLRNCWTLNSGIEKLSWSWSADWGTPNGKCTIKNNLPYEVKDVKYKITYYNGDEIVGADDGTAAYTLEAGAMKSFTFYSSGVNGYRAKSAKIEFDVPERFAIQNVLNKNYSGNEFSEYLKLKSNL